MANSSSLNNTNETTNKTENTQTSNQNDGQHKSDMHAEISQPDQFEPEKQNGVHLFGIQANPMCTYTVNGGVGKNTTLIVENLKVNGLPLGCDEYLEIECHNFEITGKEPGQQLTLNLIVQEESTPTS